MPKNGAEYPGGKNVVRAAKRFRNDQNARAAKNRQIRRYAWLSSVLTYRGGRLT